MSESETPLERFEVVPDTISGEDLLKEIEPNGVPDPRFGINGDFAYPPLQSPFLRSGKASYSVARHNGRIVGIAEILYDPAIKDSAELRNVSVEKNLKGRGISTILLKKVFEFVAPRSARLYVGPATSDGTERLVRQTEDLGLAYGVRVYSVQRKF